MDVQDSLEKMVRTARKMLYMMDQMTVIGCHESMLNSFFGDIADAIYCLVGEKTNSFDESVTFDVLYDDLLTDSVRITKLMREYHKNHTDRKEHPMTNNEYLADELSRIGIRYAPESREHRVIEDIVDILMEPGRGKVKQFPFVHKKVEAV